MNGKNEEQYNYCMQDEKHQSLFPGLFAALSMATPRLDLSLPHFSQGQLFIIPAAAAAAAHTYTDSVYVCIYSTYSK